MRIVLAAALLALPLSPRAQSLAEQARGFQTRACAPDWEAKRQGGCWTTAGFGNGNVRAFVHSAGWVVDVRCFSDSRFTANELTDALTKTARMIDPNLPIEHGGCLGTYNPEWAAALKEEIWTNRVRITCPPEKYLGAATQCASAGPEAYSNGAGGLDEFQLITIKKIGDCLGADTSGLAGVLLHETLHATGADNTGVASHNEAWRRGQLEFVQDRVYGTEALCAFAGNPARKKWVNLLQCRAAVSYRAKTPRRDLCVGFGTSFTDMPMGAVKH